MQGDNTSWPWAPPFLPQNPGRLFAAGAARQLPCVWERGLPSLPRRPHVWVWQNENSINSSRKCLVFPTTFWLNILGRGKENPLVGSPCLPTILAFWEAFLPPDPNPLHLLPPQISSLNEMNRMKWKHCLCVYQAASCYILIHSSSNAGHTGVQNKQACGAHTHKKGKELLSAVKLIVQMYVLHCYFL